jgi:hypothetical protein
MHLVLEINLKDNSTMTRPNTSGSNITQRDVYFTPISSTNKNWTAAQHHLGCIRTRSNDGPRDNDQQRPTTRKGGDTDIWTINNEGHTASIHKRLRGAFSTSSVASPQVNARTPGRQSSNKQDNNQNRSTASSRISAGNSRTGSSMAQPGLVNPGSSLIHEHPQVSQQQPTKPLQPKQANKNMQKQAREQSIATAGLSRHDTPTSTWTTGTYRASLEAFL